MMLVFDRYMYFGSAIGKSYLDSLLCLLWHLFHSFHVTITNVIHSVFSGVRKISKFQFNR